MNGRPTHPDKLELERTCYLQYYEHSGVSLCYIERQADPWYGDGETEVDIDRDMADKIIAWLREKYDL